LLSPELPVLNYATVKVEHGWLRNIPYESWIQEQTQGLLNDARRIDLTRAVVSADTSHRLIRYIFPLRGARTVKIKHIDSHGALRDIFATFSSCKLNVLSALLRRGGQRDGYAQLIAICEPLNHDAPGVYDDLLHALESIKGRYDIQTTFSDGRPAEDVLYVPRPRLGPWGFLVKQFNGPAGPATAKSEEPESVRLVSKRLAIAALHVVGGALIFGVIATGALLPDLASGWLKSHIQDPNIFLLLKVLEYVLLCGDAALFLRFLQAEWRNL